MSFEKITPFRDGRRRRMVMRKLTAVALTESGANPHADVTFFKSDVEKQPRPGESREAYLRRKRRARKSDDVEKVGRGDFVDMLTETEDDHQHGINVVEDDGGIRIVVHFASGTDSEGTHDHQVIMTPAGEFVLSENRGHSHGLDSMRVQELIFSELSKTSEAFEKQGPSRGVRERLAQEGVALPDGSFPIRNGSDLRNAIQAFGRAAPGRRRQVALHIRRRARALGMTDILPEEGILADLLKVESGEDQEVGTEENSTMTDKTKKAEGEEPTADDRIQALEDQLATANALAAMTDAEKSYYNSLDEQLEDDDRNAFIKMSSDERKPIVEQAAEKAKDGDPVVYTSTDGEEFRKSDDPRLIAMAKRADKDRKDAIKERNKREEDLIKVAADKEFGHLPGETAVRIDLLRAVNKIEDADKRTAVMDALKAHAAKFAPAFKTVGVSGSPSVPDEGASEKKVAEDKLDELTKDRMKAEGEDYYTAYDVVTKANPELTQIAVG